MSASPLAGRRVVVTRAAEQAGPLVRALVERGATVVEVPLIEIADPDDRGAALAAALARLDRYDWVVVTSPNGARRVRDALSTRPPGRPRLAAVGAATADALGRAVDLVPRRQVAEGLLAELPDGPGRVLLVQGDRARTVVADQLRDRGWQVDAVVAYRTLAVSAVTLPPEARSADAVTFTSGSTAEAWASAVGTWTPPVVVAIGPVTARVAARAGLKVTHVAADHSLDGVVAALEAALRTNR